MPERCNGAHLRIHAPRRQAARCEPGAQRGQPSRKAGRRPAQPAAALARPVARRQQPPQRRQALPLACRRVPGSGSLSHRSARARRHIPYGAGSHGGRSSFAGALRTGRWGFARGQLMSGQQGATRQPQTMTGPLVCRRRAVSTQACLKQGMQAGPRGSRDRLQVQGPQCARTAAQAASAALCLRRPGAQRPRSAAMSVHPPQIKTS